MAETNEAVLRLEGVHKVFFTDDVETHALADVHFSVRRGEFVAINGPSGSGKTTLLSILGLLEEPNEGAYFLGDRAVGDLDGAERAKVRNLQIGFIFQTFNLIGDLTVYENVELPLVYRGLAARERKQRVEAALERVAMGHRARHMPSQLSGGQQQRVAVARAVVGDPLIVLADEPTGNLDSVNGEAVMNMLRELNRAGATVCMVTHNPLYAAYASRVVHLLDGRVVDETDLPAAPATAPAAPRPALAPSPGAAAHPA
ncbi:MAG TPA: ABC transporter ATP-binding protein [Polyangiaceae bacterium]|nr:ABC transporter ATP-binding protein [Polyangiaceae bacterium]